MMEKMPSSVSMGRRRGEMMWMPEKARGWRGAEVGFTAFDIPRWRGREISRFARNDGVRRARNVGVARDRNESVFAGDAAAAELVVVVEEEGSGGFAGLDG